MSDTERPKRAPESAGRETSGGPGPELIGGIVFLLGCVPAAAIAKAVKDGIDPTGPVRGTAKLAASLMNAWGTWPSLAASVGLALIGALILVGNLRREPLRHIAGVLVAALGLAALLAAFSPVAGGRLGAATGGALARGLGAWAGALLGALVIAAAVWLAWFQDRAAAAVVGVVGMAGSAAEAVRQRRARGQRRRKARRVESKPSLGEAISRQDVDGVSAAEASMLAPDDNTLRYMEEVWRRASEPVPQVVPLPSSPYPEDVRLKGLVPDGAQPIVDADGVPVPAAAAAPNPAPPATPPATPPPASTTASTPDEAAGAGHWIPASRPASAAAPLADADPFGLDAGDALSDEDVAAVVDAVRREGAAVEAPRAYPEGVKPLGDPRTPILSHAPDAPPLADQANVLPPTGALPRPSWETAELFDGATDEDEASSVELDTIDRLLAGHEPETTDEDEEEEDEAAEAAEYEEGEEVEDEEEEDEAAEYEEGEEDEDEEEEDEAAEYEEGEEDEDEEEEDEAAEYEEGEEDEDEDEEEEDEAAEYEEGEEDEDEEEEDEAAEYEEGEEDEDEEEEDEAAEYEEGEEDEDEEEEDEAAEYEEGEEDEDEEEEDEAAEYEEGEEDEDEEEEDEAAEYEEVEDEEPDEAAEVEPAPAPAAAGPEDEAFDDGVEYEPLDIPAAGPEREHVLSPAPPPDEQALVLQRAGSLFVSEGRVAVSLLQRELGLAFEDACQVLDDLQNAGLIGPYKGGQKRDILLTAQEWEARCAGS